MGGMTKTTIIDRLRKIQAGIDADNYTHENINELIKELT